MFCCVQKCSSLESNQVGLSHSAISNAFGIKMKSLWKIWSEICCSLNRSKGWATPSISLYEYLMQYWDPAFSSGLHHHLFACGISEIVSAVSMRVWETLTTWWLLKPHLLSQVSGKPVPSKQGDPLFPHLTGVLGWGSFQRQPDSFSR